MNSAAVVFHQKIQVQGNGLGMCITAQLAKAAHLASGTPVTVKVVESGFFVCVAGKPKLSLAQKLKAFNPKIHGGEVMASGVVGAETC